MTKLDLIGSIRIQETNEIIRCTVQGLSEDFSEAMIFTNNESILREGSIELMIFSPLENSPIRCTGRLLYEPEEDKEPDTGSSGYVVKAYITHIGRLEQRRLSILIAQKRAFSGIGR